MAGPLNIINKKVDDLIEKFEKLSKAVATLEGKVFATRGDVLSQIVSSVPADLDDEDEAAPEPVQAVPEPVQVVEAVAEPVPEAAPEPVQVVEESVPEPAPLYASSSYAPLD